MNHGKNVDSAAMLIIYQFVDPTKTYTMVNASMQHPLFDANGIGISKRNPSDTYNEDIGHMVALARALRDIADNIDAGIKFS